MNMSIQLKNNQKENFRPFIKKFKTPELYYIYDVNTNVNTNVM